MSCISKSLATSISSTFAAFLGTIVLSVGSAGAQPASVKFSEGQGRAPSVSIFQGASAIASGFSGTRSMQSGGANRVDPNFQFIDPNNASVQLFGIDQLGGDFGAQEIKRRAYARILASDVGQIFGLALDDDDIPNLYLTATSAYGLPIVGRDRNRDGVPDKLYTGRGDARFMQGLFGPNETNPAGSVWKVDGRTGQIRLFASLTYNGEPNSGPGLGNIAFDTRNKQFFVSDLDTGIIFRLDKQGRVLETYDHGVTGRPMEGLQAVQFDRDNRLDISDPDFDVEVPESWRFTNEKRRVWGLAVQRGRLYYAVAEGPEVWSVGIQSGEGGLKFDARREFALPQDLPKLEISDLAFGPDRSMIIAQRGARRGSYDFSQITRARRAETARFTQNRDGSWRQAYEAYAVGFGGQMSNGNGGVALGPNYFANGKIDRSSCRSILWTSGDKLRASSQHASELRRGGALDVTGLQAQPFGLSRDENNPPWFSYFLDFDGTYNERSESGIMGDVEILGCEGLDLAQAPVPPAPQPVPPAPLPVPVELPKLKIAKRSAGPCEVDRVARTYKCDFTITITNDSSRRFDGPLVFTDQFERPAPIDAYIFRSGGWQCSSPRAGSFTCLRDRVQLDPGQRIRVNTQMILPAQQSDVRYHNCAMVGAGSSYRQQVTTVQLVLDAEGIGSGGVDGLMGPKTRRGVQTLQQQLGLAATGEVDDQLLAALGIRTGVRKDLRCAPVTLHALPVPRPEPTPIPDPIPIPDPLPEPIDPPIIIPLPDILLQCDRASTKRRGLTCRCRYNGMRQISATQCVCPRGTKLVAGQGCVRQPRPVRCDPDTTVQRGKACICRYPNMDRVSATSCACKPGTTYRAGRGCIIIRPEAPRCDAKTTVKRGNRCDCRYINMHQISPTACRCDRGTKFVPGNGCVRLEQIRPQLNCNLVTTIKKGNQCVCRFQGMQKNSPTNCTCGKGNVFIPGKGCINPNPIIKKIIPPKPSRTPFPVN